MNKYLFLSIFTLWAVTAAPSFAQGVVTYNSNSGDQVRELPGNATIVTNGDRGPRGVVIYNDESVLYRALGGPGWDARRANERGIPNSAPISDVNSFCGNTTNVSHRNECVRDVIRQQERLNRKYND